MSSFRRCFLRRFFLWPLTLSLFTVSALLTVPPAYAAKKNISASASIAYDTHRYDGELFSNNGVLGSSQSELRRLKASIKYRYSDVVSAKVSTKYDSDDNKLVIDDAYLRVVLPYGAQLSVGKFKEPFGLEKTQGLTFQYLMERSVATNALTFSRNPGVDFLIKGKHWRWNIAAMNVAAKADEYNDSLAYVSRFTFAPIVKKKKFIHLGAGASTRWAVEKKYDIDEAVIAHGVGNLMQSANVKVDSIRSGNIEFAAKYGSLLVQSEALIQQVDDRDNITHEYGGYYTSVLWTAIGRSRRYKEGEIEFTKPKKQTLEVSLRYSMADIESHRKGDIAEVASLGINYYVKNALRLSLVYERAELTTFNPESWDLRTKGDAISARLQIML